MTHTRNPTDERQSVLLLGDARRDEMRPLVDWLKQLVSQSARLVTCPDLRALIYAEAEPPIYKIEEGFVPKATPLKPGEIPDLIVVLQSWPDEYSPQDLGQLLALAPLARIVVCCGEWCESIGRNREMWPIAARIPLWAAAARIEREWRLIRDPQSPAPLPLSASREEVFISDHTSTQNWLPFTSVAIDSPDTAYRQFLGEFLRAMGAQVVEDDAPVLLLDVDPWTKSRAKFLLQFRKHHPRTAVMALVDQVDQSELSELRQLGVQQVIHKLGFQPLLT